MSGVAVSNISHTGSVGDQHHHAPSHGHAALHEHGGHDSFHALHHHKAHGLPMPWYRRIWDKLHHPFRKKPDAHGQAQTAHDTHTPHEAETPHGHAPHHDAHPAKGHATHPPSGSLFARAWRRFKTIVWDAITLPAVMWHAFRGHHQHHHKSPFQHPFTEGIPPSEGKSPYLHPYTEGVPFSDGKKWDPEDVIHQKPTDLTYDLGYQVSTPEGARRQFKLPAKGAHHQAHNHHAHAPHTGQQQSTAGNH